MKEYVNKWQGNWRKEAWLQFMRVAEYKAAKMSTPGLE